MSSSMEDLTLARVTAEAHCEFIVIFFLIRRSSGYVSKVEYHRLMGQGLDSLSYMRNCSSHHLEQGHSEKESMKEKPFVCAASGDNCLS